MTGGVSRKGMEPEWIAREAAKSNQLIRACMLQEQGDVDTAIDLYAQVAQTEEELADYCLRIGLTEKAWHHQFAAASTWASAGDLHRALQQCERMLNDKTVSAEMHTVVRDYAEKVREQRRQWLAFRQQLLNAEERPGVASARSAEAVSVG